MTFMNQMFSGGGGAYSDYGPVDLPPKPTSKRKSITTSRRKSRTTRARQPTSQRFAPYGLNRRRTPTVPQFQRGGQQTNDMMNRLIQQLSSQQGMRRDAARNARIQQQQARQYAQSLIARQTALQERANREIQQRQQKAEGLFSGLIGQYKQDPLFGQMRGVIQQGLQDPGLSQDTLRRLRGQAQARAAADLSGRQSNIATSAARTGLRGAQIEDMRLAAKSRSSAGLGRSMLDIDLKNQQFARQGRAQMLGAGQGLMGQYYGGLGNLAGQYSNVLTSYNPQVAPLNVQEAMQNVYANPYYNTQMPQVNPYAGLRI